MARGILHERSREIERLDAAIAAAAAGDGGLVVIDAPAGIGKTSLLQAARRAAAEHGTVLAARAAELEREFPFGVVRQLFEAAVTGP